MKRLLSLVLTVALLLACLPMMPLCVQTQASSEGPLDTMVRWVISSDGTLTISSLWGADMTNYASASATPWYSRRAEIKAVVVTNTITSIGSYAFADCQNLTQVTIANTVKSIGSYAFSGCTSLKSVEVPQGVTQIAEGSFYGCTALENVTVPSTVTTLGYAAFSGCKSLRGIALPAGLKSIAYSVFANCTGLVGVFYHGTEEQKGRINIGGDNNALDWVKWHYQVTRQSDAEQTVYLCGKCGLRYYENATLVAFEKLSILTKPEKLSYLVGEKLCLDGLCLEATYTDGTVVYLGAAELERISADVNSVGINPVTLTAGGLSVKFDIAVHDAKQVVADKATYPESDHNYGDQLNETKTFTYPGAVSLAITFSTQTALEENYDYIYIYDGAGNELASYTGTEAAGKTLTVPGDTFRIKLTSDAAVNAYGYAFDRIVACMELIHTVVIDPATVTCTQDGLTEGSHCGVCNQVLVAQEKANAFGHEEQVTFRWSSNHNSCDVVLACGRNCGFGAKLSCQVTREFVEPARIVYTAVAEYEGREYADVYVHEIRCTVLGAISYDAFFVYDHPIYVKLLKDGVELLNMVAENAIYQFDTLLPGEYTLVISKKNYATKVINVTLGEGTYIEPVKLSALGDITGDGKVNVADVSKLYGYIKKDYKLADVDPGCDITGDGKLTVLDVVMIYAHVKGTKNLYQ